MINFSISKLDPLGSLGISKFPQELYSINKDGVLALDENKVESKFTSLLNSIDNSDGISADVANAALMLISAQVSRQGWYDLGGRSLTDYIKPNTTLSGGYGEKFSALVSRPNMLSLEEYRMAYGVANEKARLVDFTMDSVTGDIFRFTLKIAVNYWESQRDASLLIQTIQERELNRKNGLEQGINLMALQGLYTDPKITTDTSVLQTTSLASIQPSAISGIVAAMANAYQENSSNRERANVLVVGTDVYNAWTSQYFQGGYSAGLTMLQYIENQFGLIFNTQFKVLPLAWLSATNSAKLPKDTAFLYNNEVRCGFFPMPRPPVTTPFIPKDSDTMESSMHVQVGPGIAVIPEAYMAFTNT